MLSKLLTAQKTAEILGVKPETLAIWRCVKRYQLPFCKIGSRVFYKEKDIEKFITSRTVDDDIKNNDEEIEK